MSDGKYRFLTEIVNNIDNSYLPDVAFYPDGSYFAVSYRDNNQVRVYETISSKILYTYHNPQAQLEFPHGLLLTKNHLLVSNKLKSNAVEAEPSKLTVYRLGDPSGEPVTVFKTPLDHLREAHSMDMRNGLLYVTYCGKNIGAVLTYRFDDDTGRITGPVDVLEGWFSNYGEPKGICLSGDGSKAFVTMAVGQPRKRANKQPGGGAPLRRVHGWETRLSNLFRKKRTIHHHFNGIAIFEIDEHGALSKTPVEIYTQPHSRLENINIVSDSCVVADPLNDCVYIYSLDNQKYFHGSPQVLNEHLAFPHDACFSPDRRLLIVANYGIEVAENRPQWGQFRQPRSDKITVYERVV